MLNVKRDWGRVRKAPDELGRFRCSKCREWKDRSDFSRNRRQKSGLNYACKACMRSHARKYNLPAKYKITVDRYDEMMIGQDGMCACCGVTFDDSVPMLRPCVDHRHFDGTVRDILCGRCNLAAGNVLDSSDRAAQLAAYLKRWNC